MAFCPRCKTVARDDNEKCRACGTTLPARPKFDPSVTGWSWERKNDSDAMKRYEDDLEYSMIYPEPKSIAVVVILNLFLPGLGQWYLGQPGKCLLIMSPAILSLLFRIGGNGGYLGGVSAGALKAMLVLLVLAAILVWIIRIAAIVDGVLIANKMNQDKMVGKWEWF